MNSLYLWLMDRSLEAGLLEGVVVRISLVLAIAWLAHVSLALANPRWRVLVWRVAALAVFLIPVVMFCGPAFKFAILPAETLVQENKPAEMPLRVYGSRTEDQPRRSEFAAESQASGNFNFIPAQTDLPSRNPAPVPSRMFRQINWLSLGLATIGAIGAALGMVVDVFAWLKLRSLLNRSRRIDSEIASMGTTIALRLNCRMSFEIRQTCDLNSPCVVGVFRPVILIPDMDCAQIRRNALPAILSHELSHLLGGDVRWHALLGLMTRFLWFHPLIWRVRSAHLTACDAVCDATAANYIGDVASYGRILAQLAMRLASSQTAPALQMARASSVRLRIEALHRRLYSAQLSRFAAAVSISTGLLLAGLFGLLSIARATAAPPIEESLSVSGRILNEKAEPIAGATVYVYSAGVREGTSPYCPTCYLDCGKRAITGSDGQFTIVGLDSTLVFQLLAVADGHRPQFIKKVDPRSGDRVEAKLAVRPIPNDPAQVVRGQVINPQGEPAVGAVVEPFGCQTAEKRWWGQMDGVDPLVVTDEQGEFAIVCDAPVMGLDLKVEARGALRKNFELVKSGSEKHSLALQLGATATGRVLNKGRPLAGISIGICQADRSAEKFLGPYQVGTDDNGRFTLSNLPSDGELFVYGIMNSLKAGGALPAKRFRPVEGATSNLGDLEILPANTIRGRIALADGKPIPSRTRVMFSREEAWDSNFVEAAADGSFSISGVPPEVIRVTAQVKGYRVSPKNKSFEPLNGSSIQGVVSADISELVVLFEPGQIVRPNQDQNWQAVAEKHKRLRTQPLAGVTATLDEFPADKVPAAGSAKPPAKPLPKIVVPADEPAPPVSQDGGATTILSGTVVDQQGQLADQAKLWLPVRWLSPFEFLTATGNVDGSGAFRLAYPNAWTLASPTNRHSTVWAYALNHAIGTNNAHRQLFGTEPDAPFKITLPAAEDLSFVVQLPDGTPAIGATVEPLHFKTSSAYEYVPRELAKLIAGTTDAHGRTVMPELTRDGIFTIDVKLSGYGTQRFRCDMKSTDAPEQTLRLRRVSRIEGRIATDQLELTRGMFVSVETNSLNRGTNLRDAAGIALVKVDDQGRFEIPEIAEGRAEVFADCDERLPIRARLPEHGALTLLANETGTIEIPLEMAVRVHGLVRAKDTQKPLSGVTLSVRYGAGIQGDQVVTDEKGEYSAFALSGEIYVHLTGLPPEYQQLGEPWNEPQTVPADAEEYLCPTIEVVRSTKISGKLFGHDGKPMANVRINGGVGNRRYGFGNTDENGAFTLTGVPEQVQLEKFEVWTRDEHFTGVAETREPLVVRLEK